VRPQDASVRRIANDRIVKLGRRFKPQSVRALNKSIELGAGILNFAVQKMGKHGMRQTGKTDIELDGTQ
jgi:hypothetical protein